MMVSPTFSGLKSLIDGAGSANGRSIDSPVEEQHHKHGNIERAQGRIENITTIIGQFTFPWTRMQWKRFRGIDDGCPLYDIIGFDLFVIVFGGIIAMFLCLYVVR